MAINLRSVNSSGRSDNSSNDRLVEVMSHLHKNVKGRISYTEFGGVCQILGLIERKEVGKPSSFRFIEKLPRSLQYLVCRESGTYNDRALQKWEDVAPKDFKSRGLVRSAEELIEDFQASKSTDPKPKPIEPELEAMDPEGDPWQ